MFGRNACEREPEVLAAIASGTADDQVRQHLAACARCRDAGAVASWMQRMADTTGEPHPLPDPGLLWWRAQLVRRWEAERRAAAPIEAMQHAELWVGLLSLIGLIVWQGPAVMRWVLGSGAGLDTMALEHWFSLLATSAPLVVLPVAAALIGIAALVTVTRFILVE